MSIIPARFGPTRCTATTCRRATPCSTSSAQWLQAEAGIRLLGSLGFENAYALAMSRKHAEALGVHSIADLARARRN